MKCIRHQIVIFILSIICLGCARVPRPALAPEVLDADTKQSLISELRSIDSSVNSFKGLARGVIQDGDERAIIRYAIIFKRPDNLRVEALPATGGYTLSVLSATSSGVVVLDPVSERAYRSSDPSQAMKTALRLPLKADELVSYLLGIIPQKKLVGDLDARSGDQGLQIIKDNFLGYWLISPDSRRLKRVELRKTPFGRPTLIIQYGEYVRSAERYFPRELSLEVPGENISAQLTFRSAEFNQIVNDRSFNLEIPSHYGVYEGLER